MTKEKINVLFIDDDEYVRETVPTRVQEMLDNEGIKIEITALASVEEAIKHLSDNITHLAIVDLKFSKERNTGNEIIQKILEARILPIIVFSGYNAELDEKYRDHGLIFVCTKKRADDIVTQIRKWISQDIFSFFSEDGYLATMLKLTLQRTMWNNVSRYWDSFYTGNVDEVKLIAGRVASSMLIDILTSSPEYISSGGEVLIHPGEIYSFESRREYLMMGDFVKLTDELFVVLSPSCDLIPRPDGNSKASEVLLAKCHDLMEFIRRNSSINDQINNLSSDNGIRKNKAIEKVVKLMHHGWENDAGQYFFLPPFASFGGAVVDYLDLRVQKYCGKEIEQLVQNRIFSVQKDLAAELSNRYAKYMMRLGQAGYMSEPLINSLIELANDNME